MKPRFSPLILIFLVSFNLFASDPKIPVVKIYKETELTTKMDSLREHFGKNKVYPARFELPILIALSHYPELKEAHITFELNKSFIPLVSRPKITSVFRKKKKWHYKIFISDGGAYCYPDVLLKNIPFNAQIGIIGHELAHTVYYLNKGITDMLAIGVNYIFHKYRSAFEMDTDSRAIDHGLGWQLYEYANYTRNLPKMSHYHVAWIDQFYMNGEKIMNYMKKSGKYNL